ncbi:hypothetical protein E1B28_008680 [Marasmius oreades]|uniref:Phospholipase D N-terminal domain-containing protein n=1 Tax=Marasmius oreades TaxID=181124 RepID=A0A9P7RYT8_9AGAR|nr:uncharacterized protein E1B28_008680 [Marasmius oreades]KAG7092319.1 hypothetical protein E1B28_008680 [Marasmius oreades]
MRTAVQILQTILIGYVGATELLDRNLAYRSPFPDDLTLSHDTRSIQQRGIAHVKRQMTSAAGFSDQHYPSFHGADFSNGDPIDTSVILWTRAVPVSPGDGTSLPDQSVPACLAYNVFTDSQKSAASGEAFTSYDVDWTVKVEAKGLKPDTKYFFQFSDCANPSSVSPVGSTRTLASPDTPANKVNGGKPLTLAVFSCSQYQAGVDSTRLILVNR